MTTGRDALLRPSAESAALNLLDYCRAHDWSGHDPYDALNSELLTTFRILDHKLPRLVLTQVLKRSPIDLRRLLRIPPTQNPKALALFLTSCVDLMKLGRGDGAQLAAALAERLSCLRSQPSRYSCWGYSFPWQTRSVVVPRGAPNLVCTIFCANALLDYFEQTQEERFLAMAISAAQFIVDDLYWTTSDVRAALAYPTAGSRTPIHNANLLGAALLCRVARTADRADFVQPAIEVADYTVAQQSSDGSWRYGEGPNYGWIDNFHTGYNLCALRSIKHDTGMERFDPAIEIGFAFYRKHFVRVDGAPRYFHDRTYPIDIHCAAQSIVTLIELRHLDHAAIDVANQVLDWTLTNMWDPAGFFYYRVMRYGRIKTSYMRWSQAWMLVALNRWLLATTSPVTMGS